MSYFIAFYGYSRDLKAATDQMISICRKINTPYLTIPLSQIPDDLKKYDFGLNMRLMEFVGMTFYKGDELPNFPKFSKYYRTEIVSLANPSENLRAEIQFKNLLPPNIREKFYDDHPIKKGFNASDYQEISRAEELQAKRDTLEALEEDYHYKKSKWYVNNRPELYKLREERLKIEESIDTSLTEKLEKEGKSLTYAQFQKMAAKEYCKWDQWNRLIAREKALMATKPKRSPEHLQLKAEILFQESYTNKRTYTRKAIVPLTEDGLINPLADGIFH